MTDSRSAALKRIHQVASDFFTRATTPLLTSDLALLYELIREAEVAEAVGQKLDDLEELEPTWVVQSNLGASSDVDKITAACDFFGYHCVHVKAIPFDAEPPTGLHKVKGQVILYGATKFVKTVHEDGRWRPGAFINDNFSFPVWREAWGKRCLNYDAQVMTMGNLFNRSQNGFMERNTDAHWFIRPISDNKEFPGSVVRLGDFTEWVKKINHGTDYDIDTSLQIVVAKPWSIAAEWRLFMVDGKVSSGSQYRIRGRLNPYPHVPDEVVVYAEETAAVWSPHPVFVLDVCRCGEALHVVECGAFNSAGFYEADIEQIVKDVSAFVERGS